MFHSKLNLPAWSTGRLIAFALVFVLVVLFWTPGYIASLGSQQASVNWPITQATVIESSLEDDRKIRHPFGTRLNFRFSYLVDDTTLVSDSRRAVKWSAHYLFTSKSLFTEEHPVGSTITISYDPDNPLTTTLSPGLAASDFIGGILMIFILLSPSISALWIVWTRAQHPTAHHVEKDRSR